METRDKYRFTLQWGSDTSEKVQVGELLKRFGNRKSEFIIMAIAEYIRLHPEVLTSEKKPKIAVRLGYTWEQIEAMVEAMINERLAGSAHINRGFCNSENVNNVNENDMDEMISNLDLFSTG